MNPQAKLLKIAQIVLAIATLFVAGRSFAATVHQVNGSEVTVSDLDPGMHVGDLFYTINASGARKSVVKIKSVDKAGAGEATLLKGKASAGERLIRRTTEVAGSAHSGSRRPASEDDAGDDFKPWRVGLGIAAFEFGGASADGMTSSLGFGFAALGTYDFRIAPSIMIEPGVIFFQAGSNSSESGGETVAFTLDYLAISTVAKFSVYSGSSGQFFLKGGAMLAQLVSSSAKVSVNGQTTTVTGFDIKKTDFLLVIAAEYRRAKTQFLGGAWVELSYNYGLVSVDTNSSDPTINNEGFMLTVGESF